MLPALKDCCAKKLLRFGKLPLPCSGFSCSDVTTPSLLTLSFQGRHQAMTKTSSLSSRASYLCPPLPSASAASPALAPARDRDPLPSVCTTRFARPHRRVLYPGCVASYLLGVALLQFCGVAAGPLASTLARTR